MEISTWTIRQEKGVPVTSNATVGVAPFYFLRFSIRELDMLRSITRIMVSTSFHEPDHPSYIPGYALLIVVTHADIIVLVLSSYVLSG